MFKYLPNKLTPSKINKTCEVCKRLLSLSDIIYFHICNYVNGKCDVVPFCSANCCSTWSHKTENKQVIWNRIF